MGVNVRDVNVRGREHEGAWLERARSVCGSLVRNVQDGFFI